MSVTHVCTLSWMYAGVMRLLVRWHVPVKQLQAKSLLKSGAILADVRSQYEFLRASLPVALNLPLEELPQHPEQFKQGACLLFCNSGTRSYIAAVKLNMQGLNNCLNIASAVTSQVKMGRNAPRLFCEAVPVTYIAAR